MVPRHADVGSRAITHYELTERFGGTAAALVPARNRPNASDPDPFGGSGHPVVGEPVYRSKTAPPFPVPFSRDSVLHAHALGFVHAVTGQAMASKPPCPTIWPT